LPDEAIAFADAMMASPAVQLTSLGPEWSRLQSVGLDPQLGANALPEAWLSAAVAHLDEHRVSFDRDFKKLLARSQLTILKPT
jgi:hypothetical protein